MTRKINFVNYQPDPMGPVFGHVWDVDEFQRLQDYAHRHVINVVQDFLTNGEPQALVTGFNLALTGGLNLSIAAGRVHGVNGQTYDAEAATPIALAAAHATLPRIDVVYALLEVDAQAETELRPFRQVRSNEELDQPLYPQQQENLPTELHTRATIGVATGVPAAAPQVPGLAANKLPLFQIQIGATQNALEAGNVTDLRKSVRSLAAAWALIDLFSNQFAAINETIDDRVNSLLTVADGIVKTYDDVANSLRLGLAAGAPLNGTFLKGKVGGASVWEALLAAEIAAALGYVPVSRDGDSIKNFLRVYGEDTLLEGEEQVIFEVRPQPPDALANFPVLRTKAIGNVLAGDETPRCGIRHELFGDIAGNQGYMHLDLFTPESAYRALYRMINGITFYADSVNIGSTGRAFIFRSVDQAAAGTGPNSVVTIQKANGTDAVNFLQNGNAEFLNNASVTGTLTAGVKNFDIPHPLKALAEQDVRLRHSSLEMPEIAVMYSGHAKLEQGRATVDLDAYFNLSPGTFAALTTDVRFLPPNNEEDSWVRIRVKPESLTGGVFDLEAETTEFSGLVTWTVIARRVDDTVKSDLVEATDGEGNYLPEYTAERRETGA